MSNIKGGLREEWTRNGNDWDVLCCRHILLFSSCKCTPTWWANRDDIGIKAWTCSIVLCNEYIEGVLHCARVNQAFWILCIVCQCFIITNHSLLQRGKYFISTISMAGTTVQTNVLWVQGTFGNFLMELYYKALIGEMGFVKPISALTHNTIYILKRIKCE